MHYASSSSSEILSRAMVLGVTDSLHLQSSVQNFLAGKLVLVILDESQICCKYLNYWSCVYKSKYLGVLVGSTLRTAVRLNGTSGVRLWPGSPSRDCWVGQLTSSLWCMVLHHWQRTVSQHHSYEAQAPWPAFMDHKDRQWHSVVDIGGLWKKIILWVISHLYLPLSCINTGILPNSLHKCIWAIPDQPKKPILPWVPGPNKITNNDLLASR